VSFSTAAARTLPALVLVGLVASGCVSDQTAEKISDGVGSQFEQKVDRLAKTLHKVGGGLADTAEKKGENLENLHDSMVKKYDDRHTPERVVLFPEDAEAPAPPATQAKAAQRGEETPASGVGVVGVAAKQIRSPLLSERTLEHRRLRLLWKLALDGSGVEHVDLDGDLLYVVTKKHRLYAVELRNGLVRWLYDLKSPTDGPPGFNTLYVVISAGDVVHIIDKASGDDQWRFETDVQPASRPYCDNTRFIFGCWTGEACGFEFGDQFPRWRFTAGSHVFSAPFFHDGYAFAAGDDGYFIKYNTVLRVPGKQTEFAGRAVGDLVGTKDLVFFGSEGFEMLAYNLEEAEEAWSHGCGGRVVGGPWLSADNTVLYYSAIDDGFYALAPAAGGQQWHLPGGRVPVAASDGQLFVLKDDGDLCKVDVETGMVLWSEPTEPFVGAVAQVHSKVMCFFSEDGQVFAVEPKK